MQKGTVKWFDNRESYGSIVYNEEGETFVHFTTIEGGRFKSLDKNQSVELEVVEGNRGLQTVHVKKIDN